MGKGVSNGGVEKGEGSVKQMVWQYGVPMATGRRSAEATVAALNSIFGGGGGGFRSTPRRFSSAAHSTFNSGLLKSVILPNFSSGIGWYT